MPLIKIKWLLGGIPNVGIAEDKKVWRLPYNTPNHFYYGLRQITPHIHLGLKYYRIFKKRYSEKRLNSLAIKLKQPKEYVIPDKKDVPF